MWGGLKIRHKMYNFKISQQAEKLMDFKYFSHSSPEITKIISFWGF